MSQVIAITQGDSAGIGPEIIAKAFRTAPQALQGCFVVGELQTLRRATALAARTPSGELGMAQPIAVIDHPAEALAVPAGTIALLNLPGLAGPQPYGQISAAAGQAAAQCVIWAAQAALQGEVAAMVTAPLHKEALHLVGVSFPGHTELLQAQAAAHAGLPIAQMPVRMMLANDELRTVLVSIHVSLVDAIKAVTAPQILQTLRITHEALSKNLGRAPRIAVAGLNPHAGEGGIFGREEIEIINPAIAEAKAQGMNVEGAFAPDTVFMRARNTAQHPGEFDVVLAMYHDQGLIPVKYLGVEKGVNVTLGLPLVRTSPDHGTAFDIAGQGIADASSLLAAIAMARDLSA